jgi:hypothetical protein
MAVNVRNVDWKNTIGKMIVKNALNVVKLERYNTTGFQIVKHVQSVRRSAMVI